jgi:hypothetical protein
MELGFTLFILSFICYFCFLSRVQTVPTCIVADLKNSVNILTIFVIFFQKEHFLQILHSLHKTLCLRGLKGTATLIPIG